MYLRPDMFSGQLRQGDVLYGGAIIGPDIQVKKHREICEAATSNAECAIDLGQRMRADHYVILSQCCDLKDVRVLLASAVPATSVSLTSLDETQIAAFENNEVGVDGVTGERIGDVELSAEVLERVRLVLPGSFYLRPLPPLFDKPQVVAFGMARGIRQNDLLMLQKVAELEPEYRARLRNRLAIFFGRVPDLDAPRGEAALPRATRPD